MGIGEFKPITGIANRVKNINMNPMGVMKYGALAWGTSSLLSKSLGMSKDIFSNYYDLTEGLEDNGILGLNDIFDKYSAPFIATQNFDSGLGKSANSDFYGFDTDRADTLDFFIRPFGRRELSSSLSKPLSTSIEAIPYSLTAAKWAFEYESAKKMWYGYKSIASSRFAGARDIGLKIGGVQTNIGQSHLAMRVKGGLAFDSENSFIGKLLGVADNALGSTWNFIKNKGAEGSFKPLERVTKKGEVIKGTFIRQHFLYEGNEGLSKKVLELAEVKKISDIGFRDRILFGKTFNTIDRLHLNKDYANELKQSIIRKKYSSIGTKGVSRGVSSRDSIKKGLEEGRKNILAMAEESKANISKDIISKRVTDEFISSASESGAKSVISRSRLMTFGRVVGAASIALPMMTSLAVTGIKQYTNTMYSLSKTINNMTHMNFGIDNYSLSEASKSERQRAVEAIQNASLNARYLMGNEAAMYH